MPSAARVERGISGPLSDRWLERSDARARVAGRKDPLNISGERGGWEKRLGSGWRGRRVVGGGRAGSRVGIAAGGLGLWLRQRGGAAEMGGGGGIDAWIGGYGACCHRALQGETGAWGWRRRGGQWMDDCYGRGESPYPQQQGRARLLDLRDL